jgi:hypothetical protein
VVLDAELVPDDENRIPLGEAGIAGRNHGAGKIDAADARRAQQDAPLAGRGKRVLVVDVRVRDPDYDFARI